MNKSIEEAVRILLKGGVIAYPTEAVFGLGCDPLNENAVRRIQQLKKRSPDKGLILIAASWDQIKKFTKPIKEERLKEISKTWPGPVTWVFPASEYVSRWVKGSFDSIALRVTNHPVTKEICERFGSAVISTSANVEGELPAKSAQEVEAIFHDQVDFILDAPVGDLGKPTPIYDALSGKQIRF